MFGDGFFDLERGIVGIRDQVPRVGNGFGTRLGERLQRLLKIGPMGKERFFGERFGLRGGPAFASGTALGLISLTRR